VDPDFSKHQFKLVIERQGITDKDLALYFGAFQQFPIAARERGWLLHTKLLSL
jgi:hypothetical protein